jgi:hypothetical protein
VQDYALLLLDGNVRIAARHSGAARIYGYTGSEAAGQRAFCSIPPRTTPARIRGSNWIAPAPKAISARQAAISRNDL